MGNYKLNIERFGDDYVLINWPNRIDKEISEELLQFEQLLSQEFQEDIVESNPTYASLCLRFDPFIISYVDLEKKIEETYLGFNPAPKKSFRTWEIPVCYNPEIAPDIDSFCAAKNIEVSTLVDWHTAPIYRVYFLGFLPGFLYLGGLDKRLEWPRRSSPRQDVPKGAVGIAGNQTGIYPQNSPGGWNLIGRSPIELFHKNEKPPVLIQAGDQLKFKAIELEEFKIIQAQVTQKRFSLQQLKNNKNG